MSAGAFYISDFVKVFVKRLVMAVIKSNIAMREIYYATVIILQSSRKQKQMKNLKFQIVLFPVGQKFKYLPVFFGKVSFLE